MNGNSVLSQLKRHLAINVNTFMGRLKIEEIWEGGCEIFVGGYEYFVGGYGYFVGGYEYFKVAFILNGGSNV